MSAEQSKPDYNSGMDKQQPEREIVLIPADKFEAEVRLRRWAKLLRTRRDKL